MSTRLRAIARDTLDIIDAGRFYDFHRGQRDLLYSDRVIHSPRVLAVAAAHGHRRLVLGAWGCGVFGNDPATVAEAFDLALADAAGWFDLVTFAVLDRAGGPAHTAFTARFD
ncbi:TIGR02452 family protein [Micromonospora sp. HK10]|uniref:TIGR02452 family protein n=1 Tax=Micromonospora sp. HK10 TaxID=1538294 RepID=UPI000697F828|nr:TIGR02452 family protein [Micromonospora sp. HK10]